jgi:hypothetical protein
MAICSQRVQDAIRCATRGRDVIVARLPKAARAGTRRDLRTRVRIGITSEVAGETTGGAKILTFRRTDVEAAWIVVEHGKWLLEKLD